MPNLNVCTGPAFGVGSLGELEPANVRLAVWPFSANPATAAAQMQAANGIRYDQTTIAPGGGLWVPEVGPNTSMTRQSGSPGTAVASGASPIEQTLTSVPFANSSALQTMAVLVSLTWAVAVTLAGTSSNVELWGGATLSAGTAAVTWDAQDSEFNNSFSWRGKASDVLAFTVPPSSTVNVVPRIGVKVVSGATVTWASWRMVVGAVYALIDPIAEA